MTKEITNQNHYDKIAVFEDCRKLLDELSLLCSIHRIPFFWTAAVKNSSEGTEYFTEAVGPASRKIVLTNDKISKHLGVASGMDVIPNREAVEIMQEDFSPITSPEEETLDEATE